MTDKSLEEIIKKVLGNLDGINARDKAGQRWERDIRRALSNQGKICDAICGVISYRSPNGEYRSLGISVQPPPQKLSLEALVAGVHETGKIYGHARTALDQTIRLVAENLALAGPEGLRAFQAGFEAGVATNVETIRPPSPPLDQVLKGLGGDAGGGGK